MWVFANTCEFNLPPVSLEQLQDIHLISRATCDGESTNMTLLFQFSEDTWEVSLKEQDRFAPVFTSTGSNMVKRKAMRRLNDSEHVYYIVETNS